MQRKNEARKERTLKTLSAWRLALGAMLLIAAMTWPKQVEASLTLTWTEESGNADGFMIERSTDSGYVEIATVGADVQSYTDWDLNKETIYCYRMKSFNSEGESGYSEEACATAPDDGTPRAPAILVSPSETITTQTPTYTWNAVAGATWYLLWVSDRGTWTQLYKWYSASEAGCNSGNSICSVTPNTALALGKADWWIRTWNWAGYGPWSNPLLFTIMP